MEKIFLTANWKHLLLINYLTDPDLLKPFLPKGCELDLFEGKACYSLVAFQFLETKVKGMQIPGYHHFPELNLRFYVRYKGERGVCFIREFVPSLAVSYVAKLFYNEPYKRAAMADRIRFNDDVVTAEYYLTFANQHLKVYAEGENAPYFPKEGSSEDFFKEHQLGIGRTRSDQVVTYRVNHPRWRIFPISDFGVEMSDQSFHFTDQFHLKQKTKPHSVILAEGSEITVTEKRIL